MNTRQIMLLSLLLAANPALADVYKTVDRDGNIIYSDTPGENAEKIEVREVQTVPALKTGSPSSEDSPEPAAAAPGYTEVSIVSPANDAAVRLDDEQQTISVSVRVVPGLLSTHTLTLFLDGSEYASGQSPGFQLKNVDRGSHELRAVVKGPDGQVLGTSTPSTFHLLTHSKLQPASTVGKPPAQPKPK